MSATATPLRRLEAQFVRPHRRAVLLALAGMLLQSALLLPVPLAQGWALDRLTRPDDPAALAGAVVLALAVSVGCLLARAGLAWKCAADMNRVSLEVVRDLTDALHRKFQRLPMAYFDREPAGSLMARITSDVGSLMIFLGVGSLQLASDLVLAGGIVGVLLWLHWGLALVCFTVVPLYVVNHQLFAGRLHDLARHARVQVGAVYALLSERLSAVRVVRSFVQEDAEVRRLDARLDEQDRLNRAGLRTSAGQAALGALVGGLGTAAVLAYGAYLVHGGELSVGRLLAFYALTAQLYGPMLRLTQFQAGAAAVRVAVDRMVEVLDEPDEHGRGEEGKRGRGEEGQAAFPCSAQLGRLTFRNVSFRYRPDGPPVLDRVSLTVEPGMTVGVLGPSGAGKSTLLALAPRLYDADAGAVLFDGHDVRSLAPAELRRAVMLVPQQAVLFEGTIRSNLLYAAPSAPAPALWRVLEAVELVGLVGSLPLGLETPVGERGYTLSGGQRQRLALARALLADPAVLLLDDCTSALDAETEARVREALDDLLPGRTRVIVSQKMEAVRRSDWIVVLDQGRVAEEGRHDDLLARGGFYAEAHRLQGLSLSC